MTRICDEDGAQRQMEVVLDYGMYTERLSERQMDLNIKLKEKS